MSDIYGNEYYAKGVDGSLTAWLTDYMAVVIWVSMLFLTIKDLKLSKTNWRLVFNSNYLFHEKDRRYSLLLYFSSLILLHLFGGIYHHAFPHNDDYPDTPIGYYIFHGLTIIFCGITGILLAFMATSPWVCVSRKIWNISFILINVIGIIYSLIDLSVIIFAIIWLPLYICLAISVIKKLNKSLERDIYQTRVYNIFYFWLMILYLILAFGGAVVYVSLTSDTRCGSDDLSNCPLDIEQMSPLGLFHLIEIFQGIVLYWVVNCEYTHLNSSVYYNDQ